MAVVLHAATCNIVILSSPVLQETMHVDAVCHLLKPWHCRTSFSVQGGALLLMLEGFQGPPAALQNFSDLDSSCNPLPAFYIKDSLKKTQLLHLQISRAATPRTEIWFKKSWRGE